MFFERTAFSFGAAIADIGRAGQKGTELLEIILTIKMALGTKAALSKTAVGIGAEAGDGTAVAVGTVIERASKAAGLLEKQVVADFLGNGGTIPAKGPANFFKGSRIIKQVFDGKTFFKR